MAKEKVDKFIRDLAAMKPTLVESMFSVIERYRDRVITTAIMPRTTWRPARAKEPVA